MKILSIQQPWAWLIIEGYKDVENRNWKTNFRGEFFIHASKKIDHDGLNSLHTEYPTIMFPDKFLTGGIIGKAELINCVTECSSSWFRGKYGFLLKNACRLPFLAYKGQLGFFDFKKRK